MGARHNRIADRAFAHVPAALMLCCAAEAHASEPANPIVVTGERQRRPVVDTPSSVAVVSGDELDRQIGSTRIEDVLTAIPNVQIGSGSEGPTIRGQDGNGPLRDLPAFLSGNRPRVTLQIDGRPIGYNELAYGVANLRDLDRVEVYRRPQTTTQGRNAIAGAIFAYTRNPTFEWEGRARGLIGTYDTRQLSAVVSGPVVDDALAFRLSGDVRASRPASRITAPGSGIDYNRDRYQIFRLKLLATPPGTEGLRLTATATHNRSAGPQIEGVRAPFDARRDPEATYGFFDLRVDSAAVQGEWDFAPGWTAALTATAGDATIRRTAPPGFGVTAVKGRDYGLENIVTWRPNDTTTLLLGANWSRATLGQEIDLTAALLGRGVFTDAQESLGLFGQAEWLPVPRLRLAAGVRYQRDTQDRTGLLGIGTPAPQALDFHRVFERILPRLSATWKLSDGVHVGALVQQAYNPGGVSLDARRRLVQTFEAETLWDYELFVRVADPAATLSGSLNAFYYDQANPQRTLQRQIVTPAGIVTIAEIGNAIAGRSYGAEFEERWRPSNRLTLSAAVGILRTRLTGTASATDPLLGKEFQLSPRLTASAAAEWRPLDRLLLSLRARHHSGYFSDDVNDPARRVAAAEVVDANATWTVGDLAVSAYLRNAFDAFYLTYHSGPGSRLAVAGDPREAGLSVDLRF